MCNFVSISFTEKPIRIRVINSERGSICKIERDANHEWTAFFQLEMLHVQFIWMYIIRIRIHFYVL